MTNATVHTAIENFSRFDTGFHANILGTLPKQLKIEYNSLFAFELLFKNGISCVQISKNVALDKGHNENGQKAKVGKNLHVYKVRKNACPEFDKFLLSNISKEKHFIDKPTWGLVFVHLMTMMIMMMAVRLV